MSNAESGSVHGSSNAAPTGAASKSAPAATASTNVSISTKINSLDDLKRLNPKLYNMMMQSIAQNICAQMQKQQDHLKQIMREARNNT